MSLKNLTRPYPYYTIDKVIDAVVELQENGGGTTTPDLATVLAEGNITDGNNIVLSDGDTIDADSTTNQLDLNDQFGAIFLSTDAGDFNEQGLYLSPGYNALIDYSIGGYIEIEAEETIITGGDLLRLDTYLGIGVNLSNDVVTGLDRARITAPFIDLNLGTTGTRRFRVSGLSTFADNAAAITGGLTTDMVYKTSGGELRIVV